MFAKLLVWAFSLRNWSIKDRTTLTNALLKGIDAVPMRPLIVIEGTNIYIRGKRLEPEQILALKDSASAALNNLALGTVRDQVRWKAIEEGYLKSDDPTKQLFYKAALLYAQEEKTLLQGLAGEI